MLCFCKAARTCVKCFGGAKTLQGADFVCPRSVAAGVPRRVQTCRGRSCGGCRNTPSSRPWIRGTTRTEVCFGRGEVRTWRNCCPAVPGGCCPVGGRPALCAVSGGLDSMCLLDLLDRWCREQDGRVVAAHFNHQLRGAEADRDETFVRDWCAAHDIAFVSSSGDVRGLMEREGLSLEEAARRLRYDFLRQEAEKLGAAYQNLHSPPRR